MGPVNRWLRYRIETLLVRGALYRLVFIAVIIVLVSLVGGALGGVQDSFEDYPSGVWWAFLRLSDPGYLGDDVKPIRRLVSTVLTIAGYVIFLGALVAIMTEWLNSTLERLSLGLSPIHMSGHMVVLGWTDRTPLFIRSLYASPDRLERWLERGGERKLRVVILAEHVGPDRVRALMDALGPHYDPNEIILRSGSPLVAEHLERVDVFNAATIVMPGDEYEVEGEANHDARVLKTLLTLTAYRPDPTLELPPFVSEIFDAARAPASQAAYAGDVWLLPTDAFVGRLIGGSVREPGLALALGGAVNSEPLMSIRHLPEFEGRTLGEVQAASGPSMVLGLVRPVERDFQTLFNAPAEEVVRAGDRVAVIKQSGEPRGVAKPIAMRRSEPIHQRRLLILGWSGRAPDLLIDLLDRGGDVPSCVDIVARESVAERQRDLSFVGMNRNLDRINHIEGDPTSPRLLRALEVDRYDVIIGLSSTVASESDQVRDARTIAAYVPLSAMLTESNLSPHLIIELTGAANARLLDGYPAEVLVSPEVNAHALAQVALESEVFAVYRTLFTETDVALRFIPVTKFIPAGTSMSFGELHTRLPPDSLPLGLRLGRDGGRVRNSPDPAVVWEFDEDDDVIVLEDLEPGSRLSSPRSPAHIDTAQSRG